jgi:UDP-3-O-[3-hydroxymyristoyl] glucosamine N-acyltransferase
MAPKSKLPAIVVANPNLAFLEIARCFAPPESRPPAGVHPTAAVSPKANLGRDVAVGPSCVVEEGAEIGDRTVLDGLVFVGRDAKVGADCRLYPHSLVRERCIVGDRVILQPGAVVGSDGFGYVTVEGSHVKIPQQGIAVLEDDVELGANTCVDRARVDRTVVRRGSKLDNLCQVGHNVIIGEGCLFAAQVGVAGSTRLGKYVVLAGQVGVIGHLQVPDGTIVSAQSGLGHSPESPGQVLSGSPARPHLQHQRAVAATHRLPELLREVRDLRKRVEELEKRR